MKKIIYFILLIGWLGLIFLFSSQNAEDSLHLSDQIIEKIIVISNKKVSSEQKQEMVKKTRTIVRKTAHFLEYLILGSIIFLLLKNYQIKNTVIISILLCFLYSCSDEFHQIFSAGRTPKLLDIIIDTIGASVGILFWNKIKKTKIAKEKEIGYNIAESKGKC